MRDIRQLAERFRSAVDTALAAGEFNTDVVFSAFPRGCCGDASELLAQYLLENGVKTVYVCGTYSKDNLHMNYQSHAWLMTDDNLIVDITGDQFRDDPGFLNYGKSVYVGEEDAFHRLFRVENSGVHENEGLDVQDSIFGLRLCELYKKIKAYIK